MAQPYPVDFRQPVVRLPANDNWLQPANDNIFRAGERNAFRGAVREVPWVIGALILFDAITRDNNQPMVPAGWIHIGDCTILHKGPNGKAWNVGEPGPPPMSSCADGQGLPMSEPFRITKDALGRPIPCSTNLLEDYTFPPLNHVLYKYWHAGVAPWVYPQPVHHRGAYWQIERGVNDYPELFPLRWNDFDPRPPGWDEIPDQPKRPSREVGYYASWEGLDGDQNQGVGDSPMVPNEPPPNDTKERKLRGGATVALWRVARRVANGLTESADVLLALYDAIPYRERGRWIAAFKRRNGRLPNLLEQAEFVYEHAADIDFRKAIRNLIINEVGDRLFGTIGQRLRRSYARNPWMFRPLGFQSGGSNMRHVTHVDGGGSGSSIWQLIPWSQLGL